MTTIKTDQLSSNIEVEKRTGAFIAILVGYEPIHMLNYLLFLLKQWIKQDSTIVKVLGRFGSLAVQ